MEQERCFGCEDRIWSLVWWSRFLSEFTWGEIEEGVMGGGGNGRVLVRNQMGWGPGGIEVGERRVGWNEVDVTNVGRRFHFIEKIIWSCSVFVYIGVREYVFMECDMSIYDRSGIWEREAKVSTVFIGITKEDTRGGSWGKFMRNSGRNVGIA